MSKASDAGRTFLAGVLAKIPEDQRAQVEAALTASEEALTVIGAGALAQSDINRRYQEITEKTREIETLQAQVQADYDRNTEWWTANQAKLAELDRLKAGNPNPNPNPPPPALDPAKYVDRETFEKTMRAEQMSAANAVALMATLAIRHSHDFNEVLDTRELLQDPKLGSQRPDGGIYGLEDAYRTKFGEKLTAKAQAAEDARIKQRVDAEVAERMKGLPQTPFPIKGTGTSPLDVIGTTPDPKDAQVPLAERAAQEYARLQESRV